MRKFALWCKKTYYFPQTYCLIRRHSCLRRIKLLGGACHYLYQYRIIAAKSFCDESEHVFSSTETSKSRECTCWVHIRRAETTSFERIMECRIWNICAWECSFCCFFLIEPTWPIYFDAHIYKNRRFLFDILKNIINKNFYTTDSLVIIILSDFFIFTWILILF